MIWTFTNVPEAVARLRRRVKRMDKRWTVRVKYRKVCVMRSPVHADVKSDAQLKCRGKFRLVNERVAEEFARPERVRYWTQKARRDGYKTARGCARAYYMRNLVVADDVAINSHVEKRVSADVPLLADVACVDVASAECQDVSASVNVVIGLRLRTKLSDDVYNADVEKLCSRCFDSGCEADIRRTDSLGLRSDAVGKAFFTRSESLFGDVGGGRLLDGDEQRSDDVVRRQVDET